MHRLYGWKSGIVIALVISMGAALASGQETQGDDPEPTPPNVLLIMVDDLGWADPGCYGGTAIPTPNIDRLAREGMRFTQFYSGCVVCAPARSTLMTGKHMGHTSVRLNTGGVPMAEEDDATVAEVLRAGGYATGGFGKWGLGDLETSGVPERHGFDEFFGYYHQIHAHYFYPEYLIDTGSKVPLTGNAGFYANKPPSNHVAPTRDPESGLVREYAQDLIFERTRAFLERDHGKPFFCYAAWTPPHGRYEIPAEDPAWREYQHEPWPLKHRIYAAMVARLDREVGALLDLLEELGLAESTLVIFGSDHGGDARHEGTLDSCGPLRGHKRHVYEGGIRVPWIARWTGRIDGGQVSDHLGYFPDVLPTLADLAGVQAPPGIDGLSFAPTLLGDEQAEHGHLYWEWDRYDWGKRRIQEGGRMRALRLGRWKLVQVRGDAPFELYDVPADPGETRDLAAEHPELVLLMAELAEASRTEMRPQFEPPKPQGRNYR